MNAFENWLEKDINNIGIIVLSIIIVALSLIFYLVLGSLLNYPFNWNYLAPICPFSALYIIKNAFGEEALFRLIPIFIIANFLNKRNVMFYLIIVFVSLFFAYCHWGMISLIVLSPISILFSIAYLRFGGYTNRHLKAFLIIGSIHSAVNFSIHGIGMLPIW